MRGPLHKVTIHSDWSIITPHDLESERVAMALGGYNSCVVLVDTTVPQLRTKLAWVARTARPIPRRDKRGWRVPSEDTAACCVRHVFTSVRACVEHLRSPRHLATASGLLAWQVERVVRAVGLSSRMDTTDAASPARLVREDGGLAQLWRAGIRPDEIATMARWASAAHEPLPVTYFEAIAYSGNDPAWIDSALKQRPDADTAAWLAWLTPPEVVDPEDASLWLGFGISRKDFEVALGRRLPGSHVLEVAAATGWSHRIAARNVIEWAEVDCQPTVVHFSLLARHGLEHVRPALGAIMAVSEEASRLGASIDWTELGVMLALAGNRPSLLAALRQGARSAADARGHIEPSWQDS